MKYSKEQKLEIINFYEQNKLKATIKKYGCSKNTILLWHKQFVKNGNQVPKTKTLGRPKQQIIGSNIYSKENLPNLSKKQLLEYILMRDEFEKELEILKKNLK